MADEDEEFKDDATELDFNDDAGLDLDDDIESGEDLYDLDFNNQEIE